jgi:hypothetical protein
MGENTAVTKLIAGIFCWLGTGSSLLMWRVLVWLCEGDSAGYLGAGRTDYYKCMKNTRCIDNRKK